MANEIKTVAASGLTLYAIVLSAAGTIYRTDTNVFEAPTASNWALYAVSLVQTGGTPIYLGNMPTVGTPAGRYSYALFSRQGNTPNIFDTKMGAGVFDWTSDNILALGKILPDNISVANAILRTPANTIATDASGFVTINNTAVRTTSPLVKNVAFPNFMFQMFDSTTHLPKSGLGASVTATKNLDNTGFVACTNAVAEIASGWYVISLAAADLNGNNVALRFTASNADDTNIQLVTQA